MCTHFKFITKFQSNALITFFSSSFIKWNLRIFVIFPLTFGKVFIVRAANYIMKKKKKSEKLKYIFILMFSSAIIVTELEIVNVFLSNII